jgi:hypothetical protein
MAWRALHDDAPVDLPVEQLAARAVCLPAVDIEGRTMVVAGQIITAPGLD